VLLDQVADYMEKVYGEVCGDFNYQPADKSIVEFFPTHQQFSIRITGRGWIGTVGASTGRVIALVAPTPQKDRSPMGTYNWQAVLRHEFTHTITLAATRNRIPHWFTEACAVWEQPDRRNFEATRLLVDAVRTKHLFPVKELDWGFIRPQRGADRSLAYAQSEWIMEYIIGTRGFTTIQKMLDSFRDGMTQPEVFLKVVGAKEEDFDQAFREWAKDQVREWGYDPEPPPRLEDARKAAASQPSDAAAQANVALALLVGNQVKPAEDAARAALKLDGNNARALGVLAQILVGTKRWDEAISLGVKLEGVDPSSRVAPRVLAECYLNKQSWAQAIAVLELLKQRAPLDPFSFEQLATLYTQLGQTEKALPNLIELHRRTMNDPQYARRIADIYRSSDQNDQALSYYEQIASINPYESSAYQSMAAIHAGQRKYDLAIEDVKKVCILQPESAEAWSMLAMVQFRAGKAANDRARLEEAKQSAMKALKIDPECQAKDILEMIEEMLKQ
jgi:tetratricopeptide (TPR) repeat protein